MLTSPQTRTIKLTIKSQAFLTGRLFCIGLALNFDSFGRNCVTTFPQPGCFESMLAYMIYPQNAKNHFCVCTRCTLWYESVRNRNDDLSTTCQCWQLKLNPLSTQINIYCLMTNQTPVLLVQPQAPQT